MSIQTTQAAAEVPQAQAAAAAEAPKKPAPMVQLTNFGKRYGDFVAVDNLSFTIPAGELFGFIGPNGAGKSTTIRFLATLLKASHGEGIINGCSVTKDPLGVQRCVGYMPDNFGVYDGMKVWEFLDFSLSRIKFLAINGNRLSATYSSFSISRTNATTS